MNSQLTIGIDASRAVRARRTGTERYSLEIIRHLLGLPTAHRWRLYVDAPPRKGTFPARDGVELCVLPARRAWTHRALAVEVARRPPNVLFVPAHVLPFRFKLPPSVVTVHDLGYRHVPEGHTRWQRRYLDWSTRWNAWRAQQVIAVSQSTAHDLRQFYGTPVSKIRVIHEAPFAAPPEAEAVVDAVAARAVHERYGLARPYALYVGTIQPRKNIARLVDAYAKLCGHHPIGWDLVLAGGRGWLSDALYARVDALGLGERVRFLGYVPDADLPALYGGAFCFCFPSLFEGFGLPILEAQQQGVPVMTANNSAIPEVAGDAALLVDPLDVDAIAEAMLRLSQNEALRQELIAKGHENVKRFSWEKAARETLAVLERAARNGG